MPCSFFFTIGDDLKNAQLGFFRKKISQISFLFEEQETWLEQETW